MRAASVFAGVTFLFASGLAPGQTPAKEEFEVATVKRSAPPAGPILVGMGGGPGTPDPGRITYSYLSLKTLLMTGYDLKDEQISGPAWLDTERYDIVATVRPDATKEQAKQMLKNLLTERFKLSLRRETKDLPFYELAVAKGGLRIHESVEIPDAIKDDEPRSPGPLPNKDGVPQLPAGRRGMMMSIISGRLRLSGRSVPISELVNMLGNQSGRPIIDKTGLTGKYDFDLEFAPEGTIGWMGLPLPPPPPGGQPGVVAGPNPADSQADPAPALVTAMQDQLGLRLDPKKGPLEILVIDSAEKIPTEN
jgi:uncharacterized protein (TIGR03435 family)